MKDDANRATPKEVITSEKKTEEQTGDRKQTHVRDFQLSIVSLLN